MSTALILSAFQNLPLWQLFVLAVTTLPALSALTFYLWITPSVLKDRRRLRLPPGPRGLPFVGNWYDIVDIDNFYLKALEWTKEYGDVFYVNLGGLDHVFLSSPKAVKALMDQRSSIYSSRAPAPLAQDVASAGRRQLFMEYGPRYRVVRKISHSLLNSTIVTSYQPIQDLESKQLMHDLLNDPEHFYDHNRRYSASVIITATYGHRVDSWDHPLAKKIYSVITHLQLFTQPGAWMVDALPALRHLPQWLFGNWRSFGRECFRHDSQVYLGLWEGLKRELKEGKAKDCFCKGFFESEPEKLGLDDLQAAYLSGGFVEAGSETTSAFLNAFLLLMVLNPYVQKRAQEEIDSVVGSDRLPTWDDETSLPYLRAMIKELLRVRPPNKFGINHYTTQDDWYEGMFIPKGTVIVLNWWATNLDAKRWDKPFEFNPERFIGYDQPAAAYITIPDPTKRDHWSYGAGRRACPGVHLAEKSLYLNISRTLWAFNIRKKVVDGNAVEPNTSLQKGWMSIPSPFQCDITARSGKHERIIRENWDDLKRSGSV